MSSLLILQEPAPILHQVARPVDFENPGDLKALAKAMVNTVRLARGVGLAAPQVGESRRVVVTNWRFPLVWVNPTIEWSRGRTGKLPESCLSLPGITVDVDRASTIGVHAYDLDGHLFQETLSGNLAVIMQHEIDHLDGKLITDYLEGPAIDESNLGATNFAHEPDSTLRGRALSDVIFDDYNGQKDLL